MMKKILSSLLALVLALSPSLAFAQAAQVPNAQQTFVGSNGVPLAGGSVSMYVPNTTTYKSTWLDSAQTQLNTSPITLDSAGRATILGQGSYRQIVKDALGNLQWDGSTTAVNASPVTGSVVADTAPVGTVAIWGGAYNALPTNWQVADGHAVSRAGFPALFTALTIVNNSTNCTINSNIITGLATTAILSNQANDAEIEASCLPSGTLITAVLSGTSVQVSNNAVSTTTTTSTIFPWGDGDGTTTFNVPDLRGYVPAGADGMGGTQANRLFFGAAANVYTQGPAHAGGASSRNITIAQANLPSYNLSASLPVTGTTSSLSGSITTNSVVTAVNTNTGTFSAGGNTAVTSVTPTTGSVGGSFSGAGVALTGTAAGTIASGGSGTTILQSLVQPTVTMNYMIKVAANSSGAGGVVSLGGMFGDILCGNGLACANGTISGNTYASSTSDFTLTDSNVAQRAFNVSASGAVTLAANTGYLIDLSYVITNTGTTSHTWAVLFGGSATMTGILQCNAFDSTIIQAYTTTLTTALVITAASVSGSENVLVTCKGRVNVAAGGTLIPQVKLSAATGGVEKVLSGSYFSLNPLGSNSATFAGSWN